MTRRYRIGDAVAVKKGIKDPDYGHDISGWQGSIFSIKDDQNGVLLGIEWDSKTLGKMPRSAIEKSESERNKI